MDPLEPQILISIINLRFSTHSELAYTPAGREIIKSQITNNK
jgi:hypothetical protein